MRQRNARVSRNRHGRGNAGNNLEGDTRRAQRFGFLAAAPEDKRIAAFESYDLTALARMRNQQLVDLLLGQAVITARFPR